jgi:hypothetical protein
MRGAIRASRDNGSRAIAKTEYLTSRTDHCGAISVEPGGDVKVTPILPCR